MLKTAMKYECRSLWRLSFPWLIVMIGAMAFACGAGFLLNSWAGNEQPMQFFSSITMMGTYGLSLAAVFLCGAVLVLLPQFRFFRSCFSDEGYLTLMIPLSPDQFLFGKAIPACLFTFLALVLSFMGVAVAIYIPFLANAAPEIFRKFLKDLLLFRQNGEAAYILPSILNIVKIVLQFSAYVMLGYTAVCLGAVVFRKHRLLGAVVFEFLVFSVVNTLSDFLSFLFLGIAGGGMASTQSPLYVSLVSLALLLLYAAILACSYFLCRSLLFKHLNLE